MVNHWLPRTIVCGPLSEQPGRGGVVREVIGTVFPEASLLQCNVAQIAVWREKCGPFFNKCCIAKNKMLPIPPDFADDFLTKRSVINAADRKEATMELRMRLNIAAALLSLGFLAAIVLGLL